VCRLNLETFAIEEVRSSSEDPGWISGHKATFRADHEIHIHGGKVCVWNAGAEEYVDNPSEYVLNLDTMAWHREARRGDH
jgi:hypothetical protein